MDDDTSPLCCCEYYNLKDQRTHLLALCCECDELDSTVDQCLKGGGLSDEKCLAVWKTISDRLRIPWPTGALKFDFEVVIPVFMLSLSLYIASIDFVFTVLSFVYLPIFVLVYYIYSLRNRKKSWFFVSWACTSMFGIYAQFITRIAQKSSLLSNIVISLGFIIVLWMYYNVVNSKEKIKIFTLQKTQPNEVDTHGYKMNGGAVSIPSTLQYEELSCCFCTYGPFPRRKHCRICGYCVPRSDHHCVWTNCCIGHHNHLLFLVTIVTFIITGSMGIYITLHNVCLPDAEQSSVFYLDCTKVYNDSNNAIMFVSAFYALIFVISMCALLLQQIVFITFNITGDEWRRSPRNKSLWQVFWTSNPHNKGILQNWWEFIVPKLSSESSYELV